MDSTIQDTARRLGRSNNIRFDRLMPSYHERIRQQIEQTAQPIRLRGSFSKLTVIYSLAMAVLTTALFALSSYYGDAISKGGHTTSGRLHEVRVGQADLLIPENMIRYRSQRYANAADRIYLYMHWPSLGGYNENNREFFDSLEAKIPIIFAQIEPRQMSRDMSGRVQQIYANFFSGPPVDAGNGLVRRAFAANSPYFSEDLYYEPNSPYPYAARCVREGDRIADPYCIRDVHLGRGLSLTYRFHVSLMPQWLAIDRMVRERIAEMQVR